MSEETTNETTANESVEAPAQESTDWKAEARKWEARAKENLAKASENEQAAARLAELENENKTELQRAIDRAEKAEAARDEFEQKALTAEVASEKGVPVDLLHGKTREELEAVADSLIKFKGANEAPYVPGEGEQIKSRDERSDFLTALINNS